MSNSHEIRQTVAAKAATETFSAPAFFNTNAQAEAEANRLISESITQELIDMKEAEARMEHGWVEVTGADTVVANEK